jgi:hypothetical protein
MNIEERIHIAVPPTVIDHIWSEVDRWHLWDPDTKQARLNGPFAVGTKGRISPSKGMGVPMAVTERTEGRSFTVEGYIPLFRMHFEHTVSPVAGGSEVAHRVWFTGALAFLFGPGVAKQLREGLPRTMQSLKAYAEQRHGLSTHFLLSWHSEPVPLEASGQEERYAFGDGDFRRRSAGLPEFILKLLSQKALLHGLAQLVSLANRIGEGKVTGRAEGSRRGCG